MLQFETNLNVQNVNYVLTYRGQATKSEYYQLDLPLHRKNIREELDRVGHYFLWKDGYNQT